MSVTGTCKLCLKTKALQKSHLIPAAVSQALRGPNGLSHGPVAMTRNVVIAGVRDIKAPLLCRDCEQRFNRNGENWVLKKMCKGEYFPLLERLKLAVPIQQQEDRLAFSGPAVGVPTDKLAYFAISMLWRSVAYPWKAHDGTQKTTDIGPLQEECRKYLMGQIKFPGDLYVLAVICSDPLSQHSAHELAEMEAPFTVYSFLMCGLFFALLIGKDVPQEERDRCCFTSALQPIFIENRIGQNMNAFKVIYKTARLTKNIRDDFVRYGSGSN
jgi:hypothetical protein